MKAIEEALDVIEKAISGVRTSDAKIMFHIGNARVELEQLRENLRDLDTIRLDEDQDKLYHACCNGWMEIGHKEDCWLIKATL